MLWKVPTSTAEQQQLFDFGGGGLFVEFCKNWGKCYLEMGIVLFKIINWAFRFNYINWFWCWRKWETLIN